MSLVKRSQNLEYRSYLLVILLIQLTYTIGSSTFPNNHFGVNQLNPIPPSLTLLLFVAFWLTGVLYLSKKFSLSPLREFIDRWWILIALFSAGYSSLFFYLFNNNFINQDGLALLEKIPRDVELLGAHLTHDEMLELFLHSRFWFYTHRLYGWSVEHSYRVLSSLGGAFFIFLLFMFAKISTPSSKFTFMGLMLCGGYIQLFFGDVENYTLVSVLILLYLCLSFLYTNAQIPLWVVGFTLSIALAFHMLAGCLIPSFLYLLFLEWKKSEWRGFVSGSLGLVIPLFMFVAYFHQNSLPIENLLYRSHVFGVLRSSAHYLNPFQGSDYLLLINLLLLLLPTIVLLPPLIFFHRIGSDPYTRFLLFASCTMVASVLFWRLQLGVYEDWNLVAPILIPLSTLIAFCYAHIPEGVHKRNIFIVFYLTALLHTSIWLVSNHFSF